MEKIDEFEQKYSLLESSSNQEVYSINSIAIYLKAGILVQFATAQIYSLKDGKLQIYAQHSSCFAHAGWSWTHEARNLDINRRLFSTATPLFVSQGANSRSWRSTIIERSICDWASDFLRLDPSFPNIKISSTRFGKIYSFKRDDWQSNAIILSIQQN